MSAAMELHVALSLRLDAIEAYRLAHAYRDEVLAADGQAYDGELAMLRGLVRVLRTVVRADASPEKQRAEVRQLLAEHAGDEAHARLLALDTSPAYGAPEFFQPGHAYTHRSYGHDFECVAVTTHPTTGERLAMGWVSEHRAWHRPAVVGINQWNHEYDGVQPPTTTEDGQ